MGEIISKTCIICNQKIGLFDESYECADGFICAGCATHEYFLAHFTNKNDMKQYTISQMREIINCSERRKCVACGKTYTCIDNNDYRCMDGYLCYDCYQEISVLSQIMKSDMEKMSIPQIMSKIRKKGIPETPDESRRKKEIEDIIAFQPTLTIGSVAQFDDVNRKMILKSFAEEVKPISDSSPYTYRLFDYDQVLSYKLLKMDQQYHKVE